VNFQVDAPDRPGENRVTTVTLVTELAEE